MSGDSGGVTSTSSRDAIGTRMLINSVTFPMDRLAEICRQYGAAKLSLFR